MKTDTPAPLASTYIDTPIGQLKLHSTKSGGEINSISLSQKAIDPHLPQGMEVIKCIAVLLQISVVKTVNELYFCCNWESAVKEGSVCSGEGLEAWEWTHNNNLVVIGTEDAESLNKRIPVFPFELSNHPITIGKNRIQIRLRNLSVGQSYSLHFIVAWNDYPEIHEHSCWYAVDVPHEKIMQMLANQSPSRTQ
jgi:hypothetical protein